MCRSAAPARRIRGLWNGERVRIVALTGRGQKADRQRTQDAGMDDHLIKPVSLDALESVPGGARLEMRSTMRVLPRMFTPTPAFESRRSWTAGGPVASVCGREQRG